MNDDAPNQQLRDHVTGQAFAMTLSQPMILMLDMVARDTREFRGLIRNFISTGLSLEARGLIDWRGKGRKPFAVTPVEQGQLPPCSDRIRLTRAGWIMHDLLAEAGLVKAIDRRSRLRRRVA